jgi:hypothetical protein
VGDVVVTRRRFATFVCSSAAVAILAGCAIVDQYSGRAVVYNLEAEQAQGQALLLNVVRASLRRPMQFTSLNLITGAATASGSASVAIPFGAGGASYKTGTFGTSVGGGPTFAVPVLDTQEFYNGLLAPIPGQMWDLYIQAGYPRELLFDLFIEKIVIRKSSCPETAHYRECEFQFTNFVGSDLEIDLFTAFEEYLLGLGLTTEALQSTANAQPPAKGAAAAPAGQDGSNSSASIVDTSAKIFALCFAPKEFRDERLVHDALCKDPTSKAPPAPAARSSIHAPEGPGKLDRPAPAETSPSKIARTSQLKKITLTDEFVNYLSCKAQMRGSGMLAQRLLETFKRQDVTVKFYTRSTEGLIYFLGELTRRQLMPSDDMRSRIFTLKYPSNPNFRFPEYPYQRENIKYPENCNINPNPYQEDPDFGHVNMLNLFVVQYGFQPAYLDVVYNGTVYSIPSDPQMAGLTSQVMDITKQLLNINTSAKALPQSNVLSVISP